MPSASLQCSPVPSRLFGRIRAADIWAPAPARHARWRFPRGGSGRPRPGGADAAPCFQLAPDDAWRCPHCKQLQQGSITLSLWTLPDVLIVHLKRFRQVRGPHPAAALSPPRATDTSALCSGCRVVLSQSRV